MMLEILAKSAKDAFKKPSQFRLEFYKKYGRNFTVRKRDVEKLVESVEFHPESGHRNWIFEHFPQAFQHVEKIGRFYKAYMVSDVENFCRRKIYRKIAQWRAAEIPKEKKQGILWQSGADYDILYYEFMSDSVDEENLRMPL